MFDSYVDVAVDYDLIHISYSIFLSLMCSLLSLKLFFLHFCVDDSVIRESSSRVVVVFIHSLEASKSQLPQVQVLILVL
jgi:hypothetical protein